MIDPAKTTDEFINALFDKRAITDNAESYRTAYRLAKAFSAEKAKDIEIVVPDLAGFTARNSFFKGYREGLNAG